MIYICLGCQGLQPGAVPVKVEPKAVTVEPKAITVEPKAINVEPKAVSIDKVVNVEPKAVTVEPKAVNIEPRAVTVEAKAVNVEPKAVNVEIPREAVHVQVHPNAVTIQPVITLNAVGYLDVSDIVTRNPEYKKDTSKNKLNIENLEPISTEELNKIIDLTLRQKINKDLRIFVDTIHALLDKIEENNKKGISSLLFKK